MFCSQSGPGQVSRFAPSLVPGKFHFLVPAKFHVLLPVWSRVSFTVWSWSRAKFHILVPIPLWSRYRNGDWSRTCLVVIINTNFHFHLSQTNLLMTFKWNKHWTFYCHYQFLFSAYLCRCFSSLRVMKLFEKQLTNTSRNLTEVSYNKNFLHWKTQLKIHELSVAPYKWVFY